MDSVPRFVAYDTSGVSMSSNLPPVAPGIRRWAVGAGLLSAAAAVVIGTGAAATARADDADLLAEADANFTAAEQVFGGVPATELPSLVLYQVNLADTGLIEVNPLTGVGASENGILSYDNGEFANLVTPLFTDLDQDWLQTSEALLSANTALVTAITDGTGLDAAEFGVIAPDLQVMSDQFVSGLIDQSGYLLALSATF
jgi:hypothetical protein